MSDSSDEGNIGLEKQKIRVPTGVSIVDQTSGSIFGAKVATKFKTAAAGGGGGVASAPLPKPAGTALPAAAAPVLPKMAAAEKPPAAASGKPGVNEEMLGEAQEKVKELHTARLVNKTFGVPFSPELAAMEKKSRPTKEAKRLAAAIRPDAAPPATQPAEINDTSDLGKYVKTSPVEALPADLEVKGFIPITSGRFPDFMLETYSEYTEVAAAGLAIREGEPMPEKEIDEDACKKRDPNKVENFYYQKFVRDYLSSGSPYRGLLVYHGLGSGKTCTSIAAAEALYWGGRKMVVVLTPATLSNNYRRELAKCGYFPLRRNNYWSFFKLEAKGSSDYVLLMNWAQNILGVPMEVVQDLRGLWIPDPNRAPNWSTLSPANQASIRYQQEKHMAARFHIIHYNGIRDKVLTEMALDAAKKGYGMFDNCVVVIDEVHNLVRTINSVKMDGKPYYKMMAPGGIEEREPTWSCPLYRERAGAAMSYSRTYVLYRALQNAVGAKIIALSATPMINYAEEYAVLMNLIAGDQRVLEINFSKIKPTLEQQREITEWAMKNPNFDFVQFDKDGKLLLTFVPFGYKKVLGRIPAGSNLPAQYALRGFTRNPIHDSGLDNGVKQIAAYERGDAEKAGVYDYRQLTTRLSKERNMPNEIKQIMDALNKKFVFGLTAENFRTPVYPLLPEDPEEFVSTFIDADLSIKNKTVLQQRSIGLVSFYRGGSEELMPRAKSEIVEVPFSQYAFGKYIAARQRELELDKKAPKNPAEAEAAAAKRSREESLYTKATQSPSAGFMSVSRAACNWTFPEDVPRPVLDKKKAAAILGLKAVDDGVIAVDQDMEEGAGVGARVPVLGAAMAAAAAAEGAAEDDESAAVAPEEPEEADKAAAKEEAAAATEALPVVAALMEKLTAADKNYLTPDGLKEFSPKYLAIMEKIRESSGPALVYSQFKTLEGIGIFAAALRFSPEAYQPLDIQKNAAGEWEILPEIMENPEGNRYILYTGDQDQEKRRLLLQLYNADMGALPPSLAAQCQQLLGAAPAQPDNRAGRIARVFMITQSGAEGISLFNTRQVHIMEPYWNNVRLHQVTGRAIRLCSHMNLPWDDRTVDVFIYMSVFSKDQLAQKNMIISYDAGKTTDQTIYGIAQAKQTLEHGLMSVAQSAAADCILHVREHNKKAAHGTGIQCFTFGGAAPVYMYRPDYKADLASAGDLRAAAAGGGK
jgi:hypothetical protein